MSSKSTNGSTDLLDELQTTLAHGTVARRVETLRRVTELFLNGAVDYSEVQISVFDDVFNCLVQHLEWEARSVLSHSLAPIPQAPPRIIQKLAFDDMIEVAEPVLSRSERLDDETLIRNARSKSQQHLLAISTRLRLSGDVTDALLEYGNDDVLHSTVNNPGAEFSEHGYSTLVARAEQDDDLATCVGLRASIPRHHVLKLIAKASVAVRARLEAAHPPAQVETAVKEATRRARSEAAMSRETVIAHHLVRALYEDGRLDEHLVASFAEENKFDETSAAIACLANVTVEVAETMMVESRVEGVIILAKVAGVSWSTAEAIIRMRDAMSATTSDLKACRATFERLRTSTAQQVLRFHRMQHSAARAAATAAA
jgi:uncharacterized protein (DUF2336 family)